MFKMAKKNKVQTPAWILEGFDSEADYNKKVQKGKLSTSSKQSHDSSPMGVAKEKKKGAKKGNTFTLRECPKCGGNDMEVVLGGSEGKGSKGWQCRKCKWNGTNVEEKELTEDEFMKYLDKKGESVS